MLKSLKPLIKKVPLLYSALNRMRRTRVPHLHKVSSKTHNQIVFYHHDMPVPPIRFRDMVRKGAIMAEDFIIEGRQVYDEVLAQFEAAGAKLNRNTKVFEFGVGCGRVARHFLAESYENFLGSDLDPELIQWCNENLSKSSDTRFICNSYRPPLEIEDSSQELAYSISVFTHMTVENQRDWSEEMGRIMAPGGLLFVTFLERSPSDLPDGVAVIERIDQEFQRSWLGKAGSPEVYFNTYNTRENMERLFSRDFDVLSHAYKVIRNKQSALILQRKGAVGE